MGGVCNDRQTGQARANLGPGTQEHGEILMMKGGVTEGGKVRETERETERKLNKLTWFLSHMKGGKLDGP